MESLCRPQEPFEPDAVEGQFEELLELTALVYFGIVCELGALDKGEDNGVLEAGEDGADIVEGERVLVAHVVGLHAGRGEAGAL